MQVLATSVDAGSTGPDGGPDGAGAAPQLPPSEVGEAIELLLRERQAREVSELLATQYSERTDVLRLCLEDVFERRREERAAVAASFAEQLVGLCRAAHTRGVVSRLIRPV